jgi:hypothetical protein
LRCNRLLLALLKRSGRLLLRALLICSRSSLCRALGVGLLLGRDGLNNHGLLRGLLLRA